MRFWLQQTVAYWQAGGPLLVPLALVSLLIWVYFFRARELLARVWREGRDVERTLACTRMPARLRSDVARLGGGVAAMTLRALDDVAGGACPMSAFSARNEDMMQQLRRDFTLLAALTTMAPLLGLLGTVTGMIETFHAVASLSGHVGGRVASGVSRALITTQFGLLVALPGVFGLARLHRLHRQVETLMAACRARAVAALEAGREA